MGCWLEIIYWGKKWLCSPLAPLYAGPTVCEREVNRSRLLVEQNGLLDERSDVLRNARALGRNWPLLIGAILPPKYQLWLEIIYDIDWMSYQSTAYNLNHRFIIYDLNCWVVIYNLNYWSMIWRFIIWNLSEATYDF